MPAVDGYLQQGAIFCAVCAQSPFCYDPTQTPPAHVYLADPLAPCPEGPFVPAALATRRDDDATFYCIPPSAGAEFNVETPYCPDPDPNGDYLKKHAYVDTCADGDGICVPLECGGPTECSSQNTELVTMCAPNFWAAQQKIIDKAGTYHHPNVPGNLNADPDDPREPPPARYCFVTCFDQNYATDPTPCDPADDPGVSLSSTFVSIDSGSAAVVTVHTTDSLGNPETVTSSVGIEGVMAIDVPRDCRALDDGMTATCPVSVGSVLLKGSSDLVVQGFTLSTLRLINRTNWTASASAIGGTTTITVDAGHALVSGTVEPFGLLGHSQNLGGRFAGLDWDGRAFRMTAAFPSPAGNGDNTTLSLLGTIANIPPRADAGPDQELECTGDGSATATLTALNSTDPDGDEDLAAFVWSRELDQTWVLSSGATLTAPFRLGENNVALTALDLAKAKDTDGVKITVVDTLPPSFSGIDLETDCLWPPNHEMHLFRLGEEIQPNAVDACESSPSVRIVGVVSNQPDSGTGGGDVATDIGFGDDAVCLRAELSGSSTEPRQYTVVIESIDSSGNATLDDVVITVPQNSTQCTTGGLAPVVQDDHPRCQ